MACLRVRLVLGEKSVFFILLFLGVVMMDEYQHAKPRLSSESPPPTIYFGS
jgi:hypothetical protein